MCKQTRENRNHVYMISFCHMGILSLIEGDSECPLKEHSTDLALRSYNIVGRMMDSFRHKGSK